MIKLYNELAPDWYQLITPLHEYKEEAELYHELLQEKPHQAPQTILELGCGAGHVAYFLKQWYKLTLSDISENMLSVSKKINPTCRHHQGDMRTLQLNKTFDAIFIHDAVMYMISESDLKQALHTAYIHCNPGGLALISPDFTKENFAPFTDHGGEDDNSRGLRFLSWAQDPDPEDNTFTVDYAYLMRSSDGSVTAAHDHHVEGLFSESTWLTLLQETGFEAEARPDSFGRTNFLAFKPVP